MAVDMATLGIKVTSDGMSQAQSGLDGLTRSGANAEKSVGSLGTATAGLAAQLLTLAASVGGIYAIQRAFMAGIKAADDFRLATIGVAATITDMAKDQGSGQMNYNRALAYSKDMYQELELAAARYFASGTEMTQAWNILAQKGIVLRKDEIDSLGVIVDRIKLSTQGQVSSIQIAQEMRSMLTGQARVTDQIGMLLKDRIPNLEQEIAKHRQIGDLVKWLGDQFKGLKYASVDIQDTLESQKSTLSTLLTQVGRGGLAGAYNDIVDILKQTNDYLTIHKEDISGGIARGWWAVKELAGGVYAFVRDIANIANKGIVIPINFVIGGATKLLAGGAGPMGDFGFGAMDTSTPELNVEAKLKQNLDLAKQVEQYKKETFELYAKGLGAPEVTPPSGKAPKGGGGAGKQEGAEASVRKFIETMAQETAKGAGDTEAILTAWKNKQLQTLAELAAKGADIAAAKVALNEATTSKQMKLDSDFNDWYAAGMGNQYDVLANTEKKKLGEVAGNQTKITQVHEVSALARAKLDDQVQSNTMTLFKGYLDTMASLNPTLEGQLGYKRQALALELKIADAALERQIREKQINPELADQARQMAAVMAQAKKFNLEMENNKGLSGWAYGRVKADSQKNTWADAMGVLEGFVTDVFSQGIQGALSKTKVDFMEVAKTMAQSLVLNLAKQGIHKAFGGLAELIAGGGPGKLGTDSNPMVVTIKGMGLSGIGKATGAGAAFDRTVEKAGKVGMTVGTGGGAGGDSLGGWSDDIKGLKTYDKLYDQTIKGQTKDWKMTDKLSDKFWKDSKKDATTYSKMQDDMIDQNQELFKADYLGQYQDSFTGMTTGITGVWETSQGLMTAAGVSGDAARLMSLGSYAMQGIGIIQKFAKGTILTDAYRGAAAAFAWMVELVPPPMGEILGAAAAAAAFVAISAYGMFGGETAGIASSAGGDYQVGATGPRIVHQEETILPAWAAQSWRDIVSRENTGARPGENGGSGNQLINVGGITVHINNPPKDFDANKLAKKLVPALQKQIKLNRLRTA